MVKYNHVLHFCLPQYLFPHIYKSVILLLSLCSFSYTQLPFGPPPVLPVVDKQLKEFIVCPEKLPIHDYRFMQQHWGRTPQPKALFNIESAPLGTNLKVLANYIL